MRVQHLLYRRPRRGFDHDGGSAMAQAPCRRQLRRLDLGRQAAHPGPERQRPARLYPRRAEDT